MNAGTASRLRTLLNWVQTNQLHSIYDGLVLLQVRGWSNNIIESFTRGPDFSGSLQGAGGIGGLLARTASGASQYYHADGAGNITALIDPQAHIAARYMYDPFGTIAKNAQAEASGDIDKICAEL